MLPKVENLTNQVVPIKRWKLLPDNKAVSPTGELKASLPGDVIYSPHATRLARAGVIKITAPEGVKATPPPPKPKVEEKTGEVMTSAVEEKPKSGKKPK
jgi:hypothetical protein